MPQYDVECPYCNEEHLVEIEDQCDGDIEEIDCSCGKAFDAEISFSTHIIPWKKDSEVGE